ncbi:mechanosensitive ion channel-like protein [Larkinella arboricola]|uniref:Mechanosensitive ion channel-like protein n=1 Tax=Larkinella arboricola TaxID=643671 RepID=A0A327X9E2_LARAB|nr:mechanosensitive ion channel domain-containing protein [Larkinella arboricola]RAK02272.1 mechanosensitive ion channel-like protein [Larkinella arboricola]
MMRWNKIRLKYQHLLRNHLAFSSILFVCLFLAPALYAQKTDGNTPGDSLPIIPQPGIPVDSIIARLEKGHTALNDISNRTRRGFSTWAIEDRLPEVQSYVQTIRTNLRIYSKVNDMKNMLMFQVLLQDMQTQLKAWRETLSGYEKDLSGMNGQLISLARDSLLVLPNDTNARAVYFNSLKDLRQQWIQASESTNKNLTKINKLQASVSDAYFETAELTNVVNDRIREFNARITGQETDFIWAIPKTAGSDEHLNELVARSYEGQRDMLQYYLNRSVGNWIYMLVIGAAFFIWVYRSFSVIDKHGQREAVQQELKLKYLRSIPIFSVFVVVFNFAPLFDLRPPAVYVELMQFILLLALTALFFRSWSGQLFRYWLAIFTLYLLVIVTRSSIIDPGIGFRLWLLVLNGISVLFGFLFLFRIRQALALAGFVKQVSVLYVILNSLAILCNIFGRMSLAKIFTTAAIYGLTQAIGLFTLVQIINEAFALQVVRGKLTNGLASRFNYAKLEVGLHRAMSLIAIIGWLIIFTNNIYVYNSIYEVVANFLTTERVFGSTKFTWGNIVLFFIVLYLSSVLRKYIGYFFGETDDEIGGNITNTDSRLVMIRLFLLVGGFMFAVVASGIGLDKVTVIVGALGVGIGLGLQTIVNNLVSGIILIFDKPFQIGDFIEIANKKGRVKNIGIRSSRLLTTEGSEVIIPNGDLLSGQVINWTINHKAKRIELTIKADAEHELSTLKTVIREEITKHPNSVKRQKPEIFLSTITGDAVELKVRTWINSVNKEDQFRSEILLNVYRRFKEAGIKMM